MQAPSPSQPPLMPSWPRPGSHCGPVEPRPGFTCNADGRHLPLGPHVEFKIIDYGVAVFDDLLAQATGGYAEKSEAYSRLQFMFSSGALSFASPGKDYR
jgi:hypothetical protein